VVQKVTFQNAHVGSGLQLAHHRGLEGFKTQRLVWHREGHPEKCGFTIYVTY